MPTNWVQWAWFIFFSGGAVGGWLMVLVCTLHIRDTYFSKEGKK